MNWPFWPRVTGPKSESYLRVGKKNLYGNPLYLFMAYLNLVYTMPKQVGRWVQSASDWSSYLKMQKSGCWLLLPASCTISYCDILVFCRPCFSATVHVLLFYFGLRNSNYNFLSQLHHGVDFFIAPSIKTWSVPTCVPRPINTDLE